MIRRMSVVLPIPLGAQTSRNSPFKIVKSDAFQGTSSVRITMMKILNFDHMDGMKLAFYEATCVDTTSTSISLHRSGGKVI